MYQRSCSRVLAAVGKHSAETLRQAGVGCTEPSAAWYVLADFSALEELLCARAIKTGEQLSDAILAATDTAVLYDEAFASASAQLVVRICLVDFDGKMALADLPGGVDMPDKEFLDKHCPRVMDGISRIAKWVQSI
jgi:aspartate aminotransferase